MYRNVTEAVPGKGTESFTGGSGRGRREYWTGIGPAAKPSKAAADAKALMQALTGGQRYECIRILASYEKDSETLSQTLSLLRERFAGLCVAGYRGEAPADQPARQILPAQAVQAAKVIDEAAGNLARNVRIPLLCACMVEEIIAAFG